MDVAQVSINRWVDKTTMGHLHNGILLVHKKEENFTLYNIMDGPGEHYAKWNKPLRERQIPHDFTCMWNLMDKLNWQAKRRTDSLMESRWQLVGVGRVRGGGIEQKGKRTTVGDCWRERGIRGLNVNGKNTIKIKIF